MYRQVAAVTAPPQQSARNELDTQDCIRNKWDEFLRNKLLKSLAQPAEYEKTPHKNSKCNLHFQWDFDDTGGVIFLSWNVQFLSLGPSELFRITIFIFLLIFITIPRGTRRVALVGMQGAKHESESESDTESENEMNGMIWL